MIQSYFRVGKNLGEARNKHEKASDYVYRWSRKWKIKLNEMKPVRVNFTNENPRNQFQVNMYGVVIPCDNTVKYRGTTFDAKLKCKEHVTKKKTKLSLKYRHLDLLLRLKSKLSI